MRKEGIRRIVVRGPNWLGDAVMCEPALSQLPGLFPQAEITLLVKPAIADLLAQHPAVNRTLVYDDRVRHAGLTGKWTLAGVLRRHRFDLAILFQNAFEAALISFLAGIPRRFGYATDGRSRIGHLGDCNDLTLMATLAGVEMGLKLAGAPLAGSGGTAAMDHFSR